MSGPQTELFHGLFSEATRIVVTPTVWQYDGDDPRALIISRNIQTREMTASQNSRKHGAHIPDGNMTVAEFPEADNKGGRGKTVDIFNGFDRGLLSRATERQRRQGLVFHRGGRRR